MHPTHPLPPTAHHLTVGARPLGDGPLVVVDDRSYLAELEEKEALLTSFPHEYFRAGEDTTAAQWEALALLLGDLARTRPDLCTLTRAGSRWTWHNALKGRSTSFRFGAAADLPHAPLDWVGRELQEDLLLLAAAPPFPLVAGQLCFPNRWSLAEKLGQSFAAIHAPVPGFAAQIGRPAELLLARLKPSRPVWRTNWALTIGPALDLSTRVYAAVQAQMPPVTPANCGALVCFRTERQTLTRLPHTGAVLFTIHTYRTPLAALVADPTWAAHFAAILAETPPDLLRYKGVTPIAPALHAYLAAVLAAP